MNRPIFWLMVLAGASTACVTVAAAKARHRHLPPPAASYDAPGRSQGVFVGGTYAGSDPDPNIRAALAREFGKRR